jgi:hypothetical protein
MLSEVMWAIFYVGAIAASIKLLILALNKYDRK